MNLLRVVKYTDCLFGSREPPSCKFAGDMYSGFLYSSLYIHLGCDLNITILVQKGKGLPGLAMGICFQHPWIQSYLTLCVSSLAILLLQSLQYRSMLDAEKKSAEHGCSVKTITSKGISFKLTFATLVRTQNASFQQSGRHLHLQLLTQSITQRRLQTLMCRTDLIARQSHLVPALTTAVKLLFSELF